MTLQKYKPFKRINRKWITMKIIWKYKKCILFYRFQNVLGKNNIFL
jgi:hypothetical protein